MDKILKDILSDLKNENLDSSYKFKQYINDKANKIYNTPVLSSSEIEDLSDILHICNITYNNTDRSILPIEDGFYDLLLEKYRVYNPNFQVGAENIHFDTNDSLQNNTDTHTNLIYTIAPPQKSYIYSDCLQLDPFKYIDYRDFIGSTTQESFENISKRYHDTAHEHPELVGTLDKCKFVTNEEAFSRGVLDNSNVKTLERDFFQNHLSRGIISPTTIFELALELKYDGVSVEADCTDIVVSARSRGDVGIGQAADLTPILAGYKFPHRKSNAMIGIKFEAIITNYDLVRFNQAKGYEYKNSRSAIVGLLSSSDAWKYRDFITLVPLAVEKKIYESNDIKANRWNEIEFLNREFVSKGCPLRATKTIGNYLQQLEAISRFTSEAESLRSWIPFMYDGIVVSYIDERIRQLLGRENYVNKFSIAVKFNPLRKESIFRGYTYTVGQDGSITPMINYDPVEFYGSIHSKSSGHSFARFNELQLRNGDIISVEYVNDVMPYVSKPYNAFNQERENIAPEQFPRVCPSCGSVLDISQKSAKCTNYFCTGRSISRMVNTCKKIGIDGFGESTIIKLNTYRLSDMILLIASPEWKNNLQMKGFGDIESKNLRAQIMNLLSNPMSIGKLFGSIGFTNISNKTWELILSKYSYDDLKIMNTHKDFTKLLSIKGIGEATIQTIHNEFEYFIPDIDIMISYGKINTRAINTGRKIVMTGFRDSELENYLSGLGFNVDNSNVTKDTYILLVPYQSFVSTKTQKALDYGIIVVPVQEFKSNIANYI